MAVYKLDESRQPVVWFEVENLLRYFEHFPHPTGIQRASFEILAAAEREFGIQGRVKYCRLSIYNLRFRQVHFDEILAAYSNNSASDSLWSALPFTAGLWRSRRRLLKALLLLPRYTCRVVGLFLLELFTWRNWTNGFERLIAPGDTIVCLGGSWLTRRYSRHISDLKRRRKIRFVQLIHDVIPIYYPQWTPMFGGTFRRWLQQIAEVSDLMLTVSESARKDLLSVASQYQLPLPEVRVIRYGTGFHPRPSSRPAAPRVCQPSLPDRFVLCVSTIEVRKNHPFLFRVWQRLVSIHRPSAIPDLVLVGRIGYFILDSATLLRDLAACNYLDGKIRMLSGLPDEALAEVFRRCLFTVYPSLYEGWGLPVDESLAHGKFCVASNRSSIPEVGGDLIDYFDPADEEDARAKIEAVLFKPGYLSARESRIQAEYRPRAWADCARDMLATLDIASSHQQAGDALPQLRRQTIA